jgi:hypothetical protein
VLLEHEGALSVVNSQSAHSPSVFGDIRDHLRGRCAAVLAAGPAKILGSATEAVLAAADIERARCHVSILATLRNGIASSLATVTAEIRAKAAATSKLTAQF